MGLKMTCGAFCAGLCVSVLFMPAGGRRCCLLAACVGAGIVAGFLLSYGYWGWFLYTHYDSPFFPLWNKIMQAPLYPRLNLKDYSVPAGSSILFFPFLFAVHPLLVSELDWHDGRIPVFYALMLVLAAVRWAPGRRPACGHAVAAPHAGAFLLCLGLSSYVFWLIMFDVYRYLLPLEMLAPLLIALCIDMLPLQRRWRTALTALVLISIAATIVPAGGGMFRRSSWTPHIVEVQRPALPDSASLMLLMTGYGAYAHILPDFPPRIPVVRIQSRIFFDSGNNPDDVGMNKVIRARIDAHAGRFMALIPAIDGHDLARKNIPPEDVLGYFGLTIAPGPCQVVLEGLYEKKSRTVMTPFYWLCDVVRMKK